MEKFSLYEILSFLIPGFILIKIILMYQQFVFGVSDFINMESKFEENILLICLSLFAGVVLHFFSFKLCKRKGLKWIENIIMPGWKKVSDKNESIKIIIPFLNKEYNRLQKHFEVTDKNKVDQHLYDFAYYYLEVNDKISAAKSFQSLYHWFKNMYIISVALLVPSFVIWLIASAEKYCDSQKQYALWMMIINIILLVFFIPTARRLNEIMIKKVLWSYYVDRAHQKNIKDNEDTNPEIK